MWCESDACALLCDRVLAVLSPVLSSCHGFAIGNMPQVAEMDINAFPERIERGGEYIGDAGMKDRLDAAKLDERGRFMVTLGVFAVKVDECVVFEWDLAETAPRRSGAGATEAKDGRRLELIHGKTGNAFPPIWESAATRLSTVVIENSTTHEGMRRKWVTGDDHDTLAIYPRRRKRTSLAYLVDRNIPPLRERDC
ncbi:hypothetical protein V8E36_006740 [Tilletia maclaganii]